MAKSADKTSSRSRAAATRTTSRSGSKTAAAAKNMSGTAEMKTAADKVDAKHLHDELLKKIKSSIRGVTVKPSPKGAYTTVKVGSKPIAYLNQRAKGVVIHLGLTSAPDGVELPMAPYAGGTERIALQTTVTKDEQIEDALKAVEAAAVLVAK